MNHKKQETGASVGLLPSPAPLANPYVPFQQAQTELYEPAKALVRGTLFTGLDLPFLGMINKHEQPKTPLTQLQTLSFVIQELALYLDTHRDDNEALSLYRSFQNLYKECSAQYESEFGPLTHKTVDNGEYKWLKDPWPWEYAANCEV